MKVKGSKIKIQQSTNGQLGSRELQHDTNEIPIPNSDLEI